MYKPLSSLLIALACVGCSKATYDYPSLRSADVRSAELAVPVDAHREVIDATVARFKEAFGSYEGESLIPAVRDLYAEGAFVNDRIHSVVGRDKVVAYFDSTLDKVYDAEFEVHEVLESENSVCLRWTMRLQTSKGSDWMQFLGMSQLRFNAEGEIIYHQDYWDFSELMGEVSGVAWVVNAVKNRA